MLIINLFSEILGKRGINILIEKDNEYNGINSKKALQNISAGLFEKKKFELHFEKDNNLLLLKEPEEYYFFTEELRKSLTKHLQINPETIIFGPPKKGSVIVPVIFLKNKIKELNLEEIKKENSYLGDLTEINELPLMKYIKLDQNIFDSRFNNKNNNEWGRNERRGKEKYIPPIGWKGYGLNVEDSYDGGEAFWLCFAGIYENEFAVAYYPITEEDTDIFLDIENIENYEFLNLISNSINSRSPRRDKTGEGTIVYQDIEFAEKEASIIEAEYFYFKLVIMCRVRPDRIRAPEDYKEIWILNSNSEEIRPYRILVKLFTKKENTLFPKIKDEFPPTNFYKFYNISKTFSQCLLKKDELTIYNNSIYTCTKNEYPIYLYTKNAGPLNNYLFTKTIVNNYTEDMLQSWAWCLHRSLTDITLKTEKMELVSDGTTVYRGIYIDNYVLGKEFKKGRKLYFGNFISTSLNRDIGKYYTFGKGFFFIIKIKNNQNNNYCYKISKISHYNLGNNNEEEVLITAFALFQITNIVQRENIYEIYLDCLGFSH